MEPGGAEVYACGEEPPSVTPVGLVKPGGQRSLKFIEIRHIQPSDREIDRWPEAEKKLLDNRN